MESDRSDENDTNFYLFMTECAEALQAVDDIKPKPYREHEQILIRLSNEEGISKDAKRLAKQVYDAMVIKGKQFILDTPQIILDAISSIHNFLKDKHLPKYVYHGTILGRLTSISNEGLHAGKIPVWKKQKHVREHSDSAVFFSHTWRRASSWAHVAHIKSRGAKNGKHRTQVIIRIPSDDLMLQEDQLSAIKGSLCVKSPVSVDNAEVLILPCDGLPMWMTMQEALGFTKSETNRE